MQQEQGYSRLSNTSLLPLDFWMDYFKPHPALILISPGLPWLPWLPWLPGNIW